MPCASNAASTAARAVPGRTFTGCTVQPCSTLAPLGCVALPALWALAMLVLYLAVGCQVLAAGAVAVALVVGTIAGALVGAVALVLVVVALGVRLAMGALPMLSGHQAVLPSGATILAGATSNGKVLFRLDCYKRWHHYNRCPPTRRAPL